MLIVPQPSNLPLMFLYYYVINVVQCAPVSVWTKKKPHHPYMRITVMGDFLSWLADLILSSGVATLGSC